MVESLNPDTLYIDSKPHTQFFWQRNTDKNLVPVSPSRVYIFGFLNKTPNAYFIFDADAVQNGSKATTSVKTDRAHELVTLNNR